MQYVKLGSTGLEISRISLGMMSYGSAQYQTWVLPPEVGVAHVKFALDKGINFFDTADFYSKGQSEEVLGEAIQKLCQRDSVVISTKLGIGLEQGPNRRGLSKKYVMSAVDQSLRRLRTDYIDLYQFHVADPATQVEESVDAMNDLVRAGKVRYFGVSNHSTGQLAKTYFLAKHEKSLPLASTQIQYNLVYREEERDLIPFCRGEGIGITVYSPLARGLLAGNRATSQEQTAREKSRAEGDLKAHATYGSEPDLKLVECVRQISQERNVPPSQIALAWLLSKSHINAITCGALEERHISDACEALNLQLTLSEIERLEKDYQAKFPLAIDAPIRANGERVK